MKTLKTLRCEILLSKNKSGKENKETRFRIIFFVLYICFVFTKLPHILNEGNVAVLFGTVAKNGKKAEPRVYHTDKQIHNNDLDVVP